MLTLRIWNILSDEMEFLMLHIGGIFTWKLLKNYS